MSDLWNDIQADSTLLSRSLTELREIGQAKAKSEAEYRVALAKRMLELRADGKPATLIPDLARGDEEVALLKMQRDCAESLYDTCREGILHLKLQIRVNSEQLAREWGNQ